MIATGTRRDKEDDEREGGQEHRHKGHQQLVAPRLIAPPPRELRQHGLVDEAVRCEGAGSGIGGVAGEIGHPAAGLAHDERRRRKVPERRTDLDHHLRGPLGDEHVAPEVAEAAVTPRRADQPPQPRSVARPVERAQGGEDHLRLRQLPHLRHMHAAVTAATGPGLADGGPASPSRGPAPTQRRRGDHGCDELAGALNREQGRPDRDGPDEVVGPVDWIDDPARLPVPWLGPELFAHDPVPRMGRGDPFAQARLDPGVGLGHERPVVLGPHRQLATEVLECHRIGLVGEDVGEREQGGRIVGHARSVAR